ncbi:hypothetical protein FACS189425_03110 [Clostridia bacterium]|nr:hypothetical protein FACS189425_03110 [Clostridia bacterium]
MAKQLIALSESSIGVKQGLNTVRMRIRHLIEDIEHFERELSDVNAGLEAEMDKLQLGEVLQSMKGIGSVISAAFIGEVGDVSRFTKSCCRSNPEMNKYYHCLRERKRNPLTGNQALIATGLKVMRIMFHMAKTGEHYDASKALGTVRLEQIAAA